MMPEETPQTFTQTALQTLLEFYDLITAIDGQYDALDIYHDEDNLQEWATLRVALDWLRENRDGIQALATPPAATEPAQEAGDVRSLKNRNTETFEAVAEYHRGNFYAAPVLYHNREIMCWHVYDKTDDKDKYCVARNIRTRLLAIAHIDRLNARARGGAEE